MKFVSFIDFRRFQRTVLALGNFMSGMHNYSFHNIMLILYQNPKATVLGGAGKFWGIPLSRGVPVHGQTGNKGRYIKTGEQPIIVLAPILATTGKQVLDTNGKVDPNQSTLRSFVRGFKDVPIYDVSQTEIDPEWRDANGKQAFDPKSFHEWYSASGISGDAYVQMLIEATQEAIKSDGIQLEYGNFESPASAVGRIIMPNDYATDLTARHLRALIHELAHEKMHSKDIRVQQRGDKNARRSREVDADSAAYLMLKVFGVEDAESTARYLVSWEADPKEVMERQKGAIDAIKGGGDQTGIYKMIAQSFAKIAKSKGIDVSDILGTEPPPQPAERTTPYNLTQAETSGRHTVFSLARLLG